MYSIRCSLHFSVCYFSIPCQKGTQDLEDRQGILSPNSNFQSRMDCLNLIGSWRFCPYLVNLWWQKKWGKFFPKKTCYWPGQINWISLCRLWRKWTREFYISSSYLFFLFWQAVKAQLSKQQETEIHKPQALFRIVNMDFVWRQASLFH